MNPRLEELRKRLLPSAPAGSSDSVFARSSPSAAIAPPEQPVITAPETAGWNSNAQGPPPAEPVTEQKPNNEGGQVVVDVAKSMDQRAQSAQIVATLFEPARRYRERLSNSCESIRTLHVELGVLAQSFEPLGILHDEVVDFLNAVQTQLAEMAKSLEAAKELRLQLSELVQALDAGSELQTQTYELSRALGVALQAERTKGN